MASKKDISKERNQGSVDSKPQKDDASPKTKKAAPTKSKAGHEHAAAKKEKLQHDAKDSSLKAKKTHNHTHGHAKDAGHGYDRKRIFMSIAAIILIFAVAYAVSSYDQVQPQPAEDAVIAQEGDKVLVDYVGTFQDGEVFDTSYGSVAREAGIYDERRTYSPLGFTLGSGQMIEGFDEAVTGMEEGENKTVTIPPEKAYGMPDPSRIINISTTIDRYMYINRTLEMSVPEFEMSFNATPKEGETYSTQNFEWDFSVVSVGGSTVTLEYAMEEGDVISLPNTPWDAVVTSKNSTTITLENQLEIGDSINTLFGEAVIDSKDEEGYHLPLDAHEGQEIQTMYGPARVTAVYDDTLTIDMNPKTAGKTLVFEISLVEVLKDIPETENEDLAGDVFNTTLK